jgi:hypothetical protein
VYSGKGMGRLHCFLKCQGSSFRNEMGSTSPIDYMPAELSYIKGPGYIMLIICSCTM